MTQEKESKKDVNGVDDIVDELAKVTVSEGAKPDESREPSEALKKFASWIKDEKVSNILVVTGAGISVSAGIPDFRSPGTGLYDNLQKYNLPYPEAVFDLQFFARNPKPFVTLAKELWPTGLTFKPTITHCFLTLLSRKDKLLRVYSQNIDGLEHLAQLPTERLVECHGHFRTASCTRCGRSADDMDEIRKTVIEEQKAPTCRHCKGYIKPDIVFFGEGLPSHFHALLPRDVKTADCCLVLGTSLQVAPVSMIPDRVKRSTRRVLINREKVGTFPSRQFKEDLVELDECDESIRQVAQLLGWRKELEELYAQTQSSADPNPEET
mmetsp:Transcript_18895/g.44466  ORF Transcript_18895/g.44466 Transcript_18895/m.44466 type:complete len:324 (-) Transcript_18895:384-1355(-)